MLDYWGLTRGASRSRACSIFVLTCSISKRGSRSGSEVRECCLCARRMGREWLRVLARRCLPRMWDSMDWVILVSISVCSSRRWRVSCSTWSGLSQSRMALGLRSLRASCYSILCI